MIGQAYRDFLHPEFCDIALAEPHAVSNEHCIMSVNSMSTARRPRTGTDQVGSVYMASVVLQTTSRDRAYANVREKYAVIQPPAVTKIFADALESSQMITPLVAAQI